MNRTSVQYNYIKGTSMHGEEAERATCDKLYDDSKLETKIMYSKMSARHDVVHHTSASLVSQSTLPSQLHYTLATLLTPKVNQCIYSTS